MPMTSFSCFFLLLLLILNKFLVITSCSERVHKGSQENTVERIFFQKSCISKPVTWLKSDSISPWPNNWGELTTLLPILLFLGYLLTRLDASLHILTIHKWSLDHLIRAWLAFWLNVKYFHLPKYNVANRNLNFLNSTSFFKLYFPCRIWNRFINLLYFPHFIEF